MGRAAIDLRRRRQAGHRKARRYRVASSFGLLLVVGLALAAIVFAVMQCVTAIFHPWWEP